MAACSDTSQSSEPLGPRPFARFWSAAAISSVGDGVYLVALPLLAASVTRDPISVSAVIAAEYLAELSAPLFAAIVDRTDRRRLLVRVDVLRFAVLCGLTLVVWQNATTIPILVAFGLFLGVGEVIAEPAGEAMVPMLVGDQSRLEQANGRLMAAYIVGQRFLGRPVGGLLFAVTSWVPIAFNAVSYLCSAVLLGTIRGDFTVAGGDRSEAPKSYFGDLKIGFRWLWRNVPMRTMALLIGIVNLFATGWLAVLVLYATETLGLGSVGFGFLGVSLAAGALAGTQIVQRLARHLRVSILLSSVIILDGFATLGLGFTDEVTIAVGCLFVSGFAAGCWNVLAISFSQRVIPRSLFGRVRGAYRVFAVGATPVGGILGGTLAAVGGLRVPFVVAGVVSIIGGAIAGAVLHRESFGQQEEGN